MGSKLLQAARAIHAGGNPYDESDSRRAAAEQAVKEAGISPANRKLAVSQVLKAWGTEESNAAAKGAAAADALLDRHPEFLGTPAEEWTRRAWGDWDRVLWAFRHEHDEAWIDANRGARERIAATVADWKAANQRPELGAWARTTRTVDEGDSIYNSLNGGSYTYETTVWRWNDAGHVEIDAAWERAKAEEAARPNKWDKLQESLGAAWGVLKSALDAKVKAEEDARQAEMDALRAERDAKRNAEIAAAEAAFAKDKPAIEALAAEHGLTCKWDPQMGDAKKVIFRLAGEYAGDASSNHRGIFDLEKVERRIEEAVQSAKRAAARQQQRARLESEGRKLAEKLGLPYHKWTASEHRGRVQLVATIGKRRRARRIVADSRGFGEINGGFNRLSRDDVRQLGLT